VTHPNEDPLVKSGRREATFALVLFASAMVYTLAYCYFQGYAPRPPESLSFVLWFPDWVFWGIVVPWLACVLISTVFALRWMTDSDLDADLPVDAADAPGREGDRG
jgi:RsiW-degrading membrane proteinase PrsW (M82 family)